MMTRTTLVACAALIAATAAFAHSGVKNPAVKARMETMTAIAAQMKIIGKMAKGQTDFDAGAAQAALSAIATHAGDVADRFAAQEDDPKSEAKPAIWDNFDDFTAKAVAMEDAARLHASNVTDATRLRPALAAMGGTCKACHGAYRE